MRRILTALAGIPILFVTIKHLPPMVFMLLVAAAVVLGCLEFYRLAALRGGRPHPALGAALGALTAYSFFDSALTPPDTLCAAALLVPLASLVRARRGGTALAGELEGVSLTLAGILFVGLLMGYTVALLQDGGEMGRDLTLLLFWVVWLADAGALAAGSLWGRIPLMPGISPAKTVEGALGALVVALGAALVARAWFFTKLGLADAVALGILLAVAGMAGDLSESMMKRAAAVKDSGWLFPGHGGMLDRTDSLLFAAPVLFYYHRFFMS